MLVFLVYTGVSSVHWCLLVCVGVCRMWCMFNMLVYVNNMLVNYSIKTGPLWRPQDTDPEEGLE